LAHQFIHLSFALVVHPLPTAAWLARWLMPLHSCGLHLLSAQLPPKTGKTFLGFIFARLFGQTTVAEVADDALPKPLATIKAQSLKNVPRIKSRQSAGNLIRLKPPPEAVVPVVGLEPTRLFKVPGF
jgi:hypothetical protein